VTGNANRVEPGAIDPADDIDPSTLVLDPSLVLPTRALDWAARQPDRLFMTDVGGRSVTYGQFADELGRWCALLRSLGVQRGDLVGCMIPASIDAQLVWMAASCVGACEVPVSHELRGESLRHVLTDAGIRLCLARPELVDLVTSSGVDALDVVPVERDGSITDGIEPIAPELPGPGDLSCVIYTSGTTGPSKGVMIPWGQLTGVLGRVPRSWFRPTDVSYAPWPTFHITGRSPVVTMLDCGGQLVFREKFSLSDFWDDLERYQVTTTTIGSVTRLVLGLPPSPRDRQHALRFVMCALQDQSALAFSERYGVPTIGSYGSTEIGFPVVHRHLTADTVGLTGWPRPGYEVKLTDADGVEVPDGEQGELWVRPPHSLLRLAGYLNRPDLTERAVVDGWYRTGDGFVRNGDGSLQFKDRLNDTIRRFFENISSTAVESVVTADAEVLECAAVGVPNEICGAEVMLVLVAAPGSPADPMALYERLQDQLPRHARPAFIAYVDGFDKTPNGKIRKNGLAIHQAHAWQSPMAVVERGGDG